MALFDIESTKNINTIQINEIVDVISKFFGERGVIIEFPSVEMARTFYESESYTAAKLVREGGSSTDLCIVEGLE